MVFIDYKNGGHRIYTTDGNSIDSLTPASTLGFGVGQYSIYPKFAYSPTYEKVYFTQAVSGNNVKNVYAVDIATKQIDTVFKGERVYLPLHVAENGQILFGNQAPDNSHLLWTIQDEESHLLCDTVGKKWTRNFWNLTTIGDTAVFSTAMGGNNYTGDEPHKLSILPTTQTNSILSANDIQSINIYPNPATNVIQINANNKLNKITITDLAGKKHDVQFLNTYTIDISDLPTGMYLLKTRSSKGLGIARFIKN